ncbi:MAG: hypothetical protein WBA46_01260 [Thermomicrobiales bacterium]
MEDRRTPEAIARKMAASLRFIATAIEKTPLCLAEAERQYRYEVTDEQGYYWGRIQVSIMNDGAEPWMEKDAP